MSFAFAEDVEGRRRIVDPMELRALAHPLRLALLDQLLSFGELTAARCAVAVGSTTSNCSYHLRALARYGLVERAQSEDGRERPWRAAVTGVVYGPAEDEPSPASAEAALRLSELSLSRQEELTRQARRSRDQQPEAWRAAEAYNDYALSITAAELAELTDRIDQLVRPYLAVTRDNAPGDADAARLRLLAFRHPQRP